eukprot:TRINITY_DN46583_c0_g1_i1.p2 TRINITY_DN46583_c0_g1~~TRINITY_DN46583_c0_g1_i1.p2  ORF type:complete len:169 (+),score=61.84 TRINITY_DN46583_c0_g1_i1:83-589(+)
MASVSRIFLIVGCAVLLSVRAQGDDEDEDIDADVGSNADWDDTPLLTSLWEATSSKNNDALDRLIDSSTQAINSRAKDGRGLAWWAWEFQNTYALASILAAGGDILSESQDAGGEAASAMCRSGCDRDALVDEAKGMVPEVNKRREARVKAQAEELEDDDEDLADDEF